VSTGFLAARLELHLFQRDLASWEHGLEGLTPGARRNSVAAEGWSSAFGSTRTGP
jgi:hypothetical protein